MTDKPVFIIAEAGVNHNGDIGRALAMVDAAADSGADAVKFQTFVAHEVIAASAPKAPYQIQTTGAAESQLEMVRALTLAPADHEVLIERCRARGIEFLSTPFDLISLALLVKLDLRLIKLASGEVTNAPLLYAAGKSGKPVILSTGMSRLDEVAAALGVLAQGYLGGPPGTAHFQAAAASAEGRAALAANVTLLHCTTEYPSPFADVNLRAMDAMARAFGLPVGLSDHTPGISIPIAAAARGAVVVEKHFTLDRTLPGPDHKASLEVPELAAMVAAIRQVELALGDGTKEPAPSEERNRIIARRSLVARRAIAKGEVITEDSLAVKRPATGLSPMAFWEVVGTVAKRDFAADEPVAL